jgi:hypothetical protein
MDYYLNTENTFQRILKEYEEHNSLVVAYDFDNTVYDFHKKGWLFDDVINLLKKLKSINCYLIVFTANSDTKMVENYLRDNEIPFDDINNNPPFYTSDQRKIYYNILLDDRAGLAECFNHLTRLAEKQT